MSCPNFARVLLPLMRMSGALDTMSRLTDTALKIVETRKKEDIVVSEVVWSERSYFTVLGLYREKIFFS